MSEPECPKCRGSMLQGFVLDHTYGANLVSEWFGGAPKQSFWRSVKAPSFTGVPIGAFRCSKCGYLESYADPKFAAS